MDERENIYREGKEIEGLNVEDELRCTCWKKDSATWQSKAKPFSGLWGYGYNFHSFYLL